MMLRIMWCRKASASNSKCQRQRSSSPWRVISMRRRSLTGDSAWQAEARKELKSCSAQQHGGGGPHRVAVERVDRPADPARVQARAHRRLRTARRGSAASRRWRGNGTGRARAAPIAPRCRPAGSGWCRAPRRRARARPRCRSAPPASAHARRHRCGPRKGWRWAGRRSGRARPPACPGRCGPRAGSASRRRPGRGSGRRGPASPARSATAWPLSAARPSSCLASALTSPEALGGHFLDQRAGAFDVAQRLEFARQRQLDGVRAFAAVLGQRLQAAALGVGGRRAGRPASSCRTR